MSLTDWPSQKQFQTMDVPKKEISNFAHSYKLNYYIFLWGRNIGYVGNWLWINERLEMNRT
jgi:hypothetical protein